MILLPNFDLHRYRYWGEGMSISVPIFNETGAASLILQINSIKNNLFKQQHK